MSAVATETICFGDTSMSWTMPGRLGHVLFGVPRDRLESAVMLDRSSSSGVLACAMMYSSSRSAVR